ncbi:MAG: o-succinylbenzoate synthase [Muribaculaceae bacterium]|nr:o-succinylbenzoate synthase [Muribaculaceae bacterium]MDE7142702.1 o-succinylbenzoate synthase [Muribaculaceae bacterium]
MLRASYAPYSFVFRETALTSRQSMNAKDTYLLRLSDGTRSAVGEVPLFRGLSAEDSPEFERVLASLCESGEGGDMPSSIRFGFETASAALVSGSQETLFDTPWSRGEKGIRINGLVWMGDRRTMARRTREKLDGGFRCVKLKVGGIDFADELALLRYIRSEFGPGDIELRLDANGAFTPDNAYDRLGYLSELDIHSIEQPIRAGQWDAMAEICAGSPIPVALDEELIGICSDERKTRMLDIIRPSYIILKPSLCGGFSEADRWIDLAEERGIGWWATSALESDLGLNAIAQWVSIRDPHMPQGLGTGQLYVNNFPSPLELRGEELWFNPEKRFSIPSVDWR